MKAPMKSVASRNIIDDGKMKLKKALAIISAVFFADSAISKGQKKYKYSSKMLTLY